MIGSLTWFSQFGINRNKMSIKSIFKRSDVTAFVKLFKLLYKDDLFNLPQEKDLFITSERQYGSTYKHDFLEQYKIYIELYNQLTNKGMQTYSYFLSINTAVIGILGYAVIKVVPTINEEDIIVTISLLFISFLAMFFSIMCYIICKLTMRLAVAKMKVICMIEKRLPLALHPAQTSSLEYTSLIKLFSTLMVLDTVIYYFIISAYSAVFIYFLVTFYF